MDKFTVETGNKNTTKSGTVSSGISVDTLNNYKKLTELIPELEDIVDTGIVTKDAFAEKNKGKRS